MTTDSSDFGDSNFNPNWRGQKVIDRYAKFIQRIKKVGFTYMNEGSFRMVFQRGKVVIKVPKVTDGIIDNRVEHRAYHTYWNGPTPNRILLAPCRLLSNDCLMMMRVGSSAPLAYPRWSKKIDAEQLSPYKGRMVAYDYALDLTERFEWEKEWGYPSQFFNSEAWIKRRPHLRNFLRKREQRKAG